MVEALPDGSELWTLDVPLSSADDQYLRNCFASMESFDRLISEVTDPMDPRIENAIKAMISKIIDEEKQKELNEKYESLFFKSVDEFRMTKNLSENAEISAYDMGRIRWKVCFQIRGEIQNWFSQFLNVTSKQRVCFRKVMQG